MPRVCHPESLSVAETYDVLGWTEPERPHAAIRQISNLNTPTELLAKAPASRDSLSVDELDLIVNRLQLEVCTPGTSRHYMWIHVPGNLEARTLVSAREAVDDDLFMGLWRFSITDEGVKTKRVAKFTQNNPDPVPLPPMAKDEHQYNLASSRDEIVRGDDHCRPLLGRRRFLERYLPTASVVFAMDFKKKGVFAMDFKKKGVFEYMPIVPELNDLWTELSEDEKAHYKERSEVLRHAAWDEWDEN
ncbi:hypothetical protein G7054_g7696 [Neopestalotiopsis clavispora]|nr:hypothetical protein G7054_g7696 [Neopestalotiopsis clavispora]